MKGHQASSVQASSRNSETFCPDREIVALAATDLAEHFHFRRHLDGIEIDCQGGALSVSGKLPSYYLKQLLQTVLREIPGVKRINNQVSVVSSTGLSDCP